MKNFLAILSLFPECLRRGELSNGGLLQPTGFARTGVRLDGSLRSTSEVVMKTRIMGLMSLAVLASAASAQTQTAQDGAIAALRDAPVVALTHVRIIDGTGVAAKEDQTLVIEAGKIRAVGSQNEIEVPEHTHTLDLTGRTVLPGLVMLHEHLDYHASQGSRLPRDLVLGLTHPQHFSFPRLYLAAGVTTIRTAGTDFPYMDLNLKGRIDAGEVPGPEIRLTSPFLSGEGDPFLGAKLVRDSSGARRAVRYWAAEGFTSFKVYQWISKDALAAVIDEAHRLGLPVTAHLGAGAVSCREAAEMGIDNLEHGFGPCIRADELEPELNGPRTEALLRTLIDRDVVLTYTDNKVPEQLSDRANQLLDVSARARYSRALAARRLRLPGLGTGRDLQDSPYAHLTLAFARAGGRLVLGSDAGCCGGGNNIPGVNSHHTLKVLASMGFSALEVIRMATLGGATFLGIDDRTGSIQTGKEADLLIVRGNPSKRIEDLDNVEMVFTNGIAYDPNMLLDTVKGEVGWH